MNCVCCSSALFFNVPTDCDAQKSLCCSYPVKLMFVLCLFSAFRARLMLFVVCLTSIYRARLMVFVLCLFSACRARLTVFVLCLTRAYRARLTVFVPSLFDQGL